MTTLASSIFGADASQTFGNSKVDSRKLSAEDAAKFAALWNQHITKPSPTLSPLSEVKASAQTRFDTQALAQSGMNATGKTAVDKFMKFMEASHDGLGSFVRAQYLASKGLTEESFSKLSQEEKDKINDDIKKQIEEAVRKKTEEEAAKAAA